MNLQIKKDKKSWQQFEHLVKEIIQELSPNAIVKHNIKLKGKSCKDRQIDVLVELDLGNEQIIKIAVECKKYKSRVDIKDVDSFVGMLIDVGINNGILVSKSGFSRAAINRAKINNIILCDLFSLDNIDLSNSLIIGQHIRLLRILKPQCELGCLNQSIADFAKEKGEDLILYDSNSLALGRIKAIIIRKLYKGFGQEISNGSNHITLERIAFIKFRKEYYQTCINLIFEAKIENYIGKLPLKEFSALFNYSKGEFHNKQKILTKKIKFDRNSKEWELVNSVHERNRRLPCLFTLDVNSWGDIPFEVIYYRKSALDPIVVEWKSIDDDKIYRSAFSGKASIDEFNT